MANRKTKNKRGANPRNYTVQVVLSKETGKPVKFIKHKTDPKIGEF